MFRLVVSKNQIKVAQTEPMTSGSVDVYQIQFEFSDDWDGFLKFAVFDDGDVRIEIPLDESNICNIPWEVMTDPGDTVEAGVYGAKGKQVLPTIWATLGKIQEGVIEGEAPADSPSGWQAAFSQIAVSKGDNLNFIDGDLQLRSGENVLSTLRLTVDDFEGDSTRPMSAAGVENIVGNIDVLLRTI